MFLGHPVVISHQLSGVKEGVKNPVIESVHELGTFADEKVSLAPPLKFFCPNMQFLHNNLVSTVE